MKLIPVLLALVMLAGLPAAASAQDGAKKQGRKREALLKKFDNDGDGKLSKEERAAARESRGKGGKLGKKILRRFDKDGDHKLNDAEREALKKFMDSHRGKRGKRGSK